MSSLLDTAKTSYNVILGLYWIAAHFFRAGGGKGGYPPIKSLSYIILYVNITIEIYNYQKNHFTPPSSFGTPIEVPYFTQKKTF